VPRNLWKHLSRGPVILMYHAIGTDRERASCYLVLERRFRRQLTLLKWCRYRVISLQELVESLRENRVFPGRSVVITFDDGFADTFERAFPLLRRHGFPATVFLVSGSIGATASWASDPALFQRPLLTAQQIAEMRDAGIEIGAHTRTHP